MQDFSVYSNRKLYNFLLILKLQNNEFNYPEADTK